MCIGAGFISDSALDKLQEDQDERKKKKRENKILKKYEDELEKYEDGAWDWKYWDLNLQRRI